MMKIYTIFYAIFVFIVGFFFAMFFLRKEKKKEHIFHTISIFAYSPLVLWSLTYFIVCLVYAGIRLSWIWLWPALAIFGYLRMAALRSEMRGKSLVKLPAGLRYFYRVCVVAGLLIFVIVEFRVVRFMNSSPQPDLEYVIVLGCGVIGRNPSNPLRLRIQKAAEYMQNNPDTLLIASGGQGMDEQISEAECIKQQLVEIYRISADRILLEDASSSTEENLRFSRQIIGNTNASVGIVTNGYHEYRAILIAQKEGFKNVHAISAITLMPVGIHYIVREFFGIVKEWLIDFWLKIQYNFV